MNKPRQKNGRLWLAALPLYDMALAVYGGTTFADLSMPAY